MWMTKQISAFLFFFIRELCGRRQPLSEFCFTRELCGRRQPLVRWKTEWRPRTKNLQKLFACPRRWIRMVSGIKV
jgi:hypothetical protein